ncbi:hypothetical protein [Pseudomonas rhizoryzae]|nr:hypothetical protein [Pseudomonas rhizoryzae]
MPARQEIQIIDFKTQCDLEFSSQDEEIIMDFFCSGSADQYRLGRLVDG